MAGSFPDDLRYTESDEWVRQENGEVICGITSFASDQLGDVVYLQLPDVGRRLNKGESFGEIESVKAVSDLNCPLAGQVAAANDALDQNPALVNEDPYGRGWIIRLRPDDPEAFNTLLDAQAYQQSTTERH